jgi:hypothetical protein
MGDKKNLTTKRRGIAAVKIGISLVLIAVVLYFIDLGELANLISTANPWYFVAAIAVLYADRALMAYKWGLLLEAVDVRIPLSILFRIYATSPLPGVMLPSNIGGDLFRLFSVAQYDKTKTGAVLASLVVERVIAVLGLLIIVLLSMVLAIHVIDDSWSYISRISWALLVSTIVAGVILGILYCLAARKLGALGASLKQHSICRKIQKIYSLCCEYRKYRRTVLVVFLWTLAEQIVPIVGFLLRGYALHIDVSIVQLAIIVPIVVFIVRLPITFNGYGIEEGIYIALLGLVGVSPSEAFLLSMSGRILLLLTAIPAGIYSILSGGVPQSEAVEEVKLS